MEFLCYEVILVDCTSIVLHHVGGCGEAVVCAGRDKILSYPLIVVRSSCVSAGEQDDQEMKCALNIS